ncbi:MAG TPA: universal stress protein [Bacteroidia bacterium]|jgi:nucleotide-binding universal stress UspA family protein|nr:universal stress protein [Bacteroidia bacterium]
MAKLNSKKVLIAIDFGEQSLIAMAQGINLSKVIGAEVTLLHVIEDGGMLGKNLKTSEYEKVRKEVDALLNEQIHLLEEKHKDIQVSALVARGRVYEKIIEIAEMIQAEFIVMGCKGTGGLKRKFIGSNALQVVRASHCPVLTIKGKHHHAGCKNIVLPLDLTKETREKVGRAIEFARLYKSAVRVLSVIFTKDEFIVNRLTRQLAQVKAYLEKAGIECSAEIVKGIKGEENLAQCIVDYSSKVDGDLLLIMTQQEVDFTDYFIGSSAQEIILRAEMPVLSIIPGSEKNRVPLKPSKS